MGFYIERIPEVDRIPAHLVMQYVDKKHTTNSIKKIIRDTNKWKKSIHILLYAISNKKIYGIMKFIYLHEVRAFFIAYYAAKQDTKFSSQDIFDVFLKKLRPIIESNYDLYFEISENRGRGKEKLFSERAREIGYNATCLLGNYLQPEVAKFDEGLMQRYPSKLYVLSKDRKRHSNPKVIVENIFKYAYQDLFRTKDEQYYWAYSKLLQAIKIEIFQNSQLVSRSTKMESHIKGK